MTKTVPQSIWYGFSDYVPLRGINSNSFSIGGKKKKQISNGKMYFV
jgi:hypothetical protein